MNMCPDFFFWTDLPMPPSKSGPSARAAMIPGPGIIRAWDSPHQDLNPKTGFCQMVGWGPNINSSYLGKAYSKTRFSNACSVSTVVDKDQSALPDVALQHCPSSLQANCWPVLSLPGWQLCELGLKPFSNHLQIPLPTHVQQNSLFPAAKNFSNGNAEIKLWQQSPLDLNISTYKSKRKQKSRSSYLCGFQGCEVTCLAAARCTPREERPLFSHWHFVASGWGSGKALLSSAGSQSMVLSPFPVTQDPARAPLTSFGTELEQGWAKSSPSNGRRKGVYANAWVLVGISSLRGSHWAVKLIIFNELGQSWLCYFVTY